MGKPDYSSAPQIAMPNFKDPMEGLAPQLDALNQQIADLQTQILSPPEPPELAALKDVEMIDWSDVEKKLSEAERKKLKEQQKSKLSLHDLIVADPNEDEPSLLG
jgi:hypothetical protein